MKEAGIFAREFSTLGRWVQVGVAAGRVISVSFPQSPDEEATETHELLDRIESYLAGTPETFEDVTVALTVPTDHRRVLELLRDIPYGETIRLERLVKMTPMLDSADDDDRERVRHALTGNPTPLLIPDHRVEDTQGATPPGVAATLRAIEAGEGDG